MSLGLGLSLVKTTFLRAFQGWMANSDNWEDVVTNWEVTE